MTTSAPTTSPAVAHMPRRCAGAAGRCPAPPSWFPPGATQEGWCTWHALSARHPWCDTVVEFHAFVTSLRAGRYCTWLTPAPDALWTWLHGGGPLPRVAACEHPGCPHAQAPPMAAPGWTTTTQAELAIVEAAR